MRVLLIAWYFPPSRTIAAVRLGNLAKHLLREGHDVRVLTPQNPPLPQELDLDFPSDRVVRTRWQEATKDVDYGSVLPAAGTMASETPRAARLRQYYWRLRQSLEEFPDNRAAWLPYASTAGERLVAGWRPDLIYASGPPFTTLLIGKTLSIDHDIPLIVEFRDRWSDDPYWPPPIWRRWYDRRVEASVIGQAAGLVTVSEPWAASYRERYGKATEVVSNGYDAEFIAQGPFDGTPGTSCLEIVYTGGIYPGYRDPSPLFAAMKRAEEQGYSCHMTFHGTSPSLFMPLAEAQGIAHRVEAGMTLSHTESLRRQRDSDILVLMQWNDPREQGNVPGKFFEYLGARRPILVLGFHDGVPARIVRERQAGFCSTDSDEIAVQLIRWLKIKQEKGLIPPIPESAIRGFSRDEQFSRLTPFFQKVLGSNT